ncbi:hypothetical protein SF123566_2397 [Shigella flexneri 1235-66]|nr:hypothetical protein SF123566_2397 [Shigella flexneri 1235-66]
MVACGSDCRRNAEPGVKRRTKNAKAFFVRRFSRYWCDCRAIYLQED